MTLFTFPDVELWATAYLRAALAARGWLGVYVSNRPPSPRQERQVIVRRDGGPTDRVRDLPRMSVRVWGVDDAEAVRLAGDVSALLRTAAGVGPCRRAEQLSGPSLTSDEAGAPMRYLLFQFVMKGSAT